MPELPIVAPGEIIASQHINDIADRIIQRYTDASDLATKNPTPITGELAYQIDTGQVMVFNGTDWVLGGGGVSTGELRIVSNNGQGFVVVRGTAELDVFQDGNLISQIHATLGATDVGTIEFRSLNVPDAGIKIVSDQQVMLGEPGANGTFTVNPANQTATAETFLQVHNIGTTGSAANTFLQTIPGDLSRFQLSTSARKYKSDIQYAHHLADVVLEPVTFRHDGDGGDYAGFIADDLADQNTLLGVYDVDGEIENYDLRAVVAVLAAKVNALMDRIETLEE
jgi:hypothetical protein